MAKDLYLAYVEDLETIDSFLALHEMRDVLRNNKSRDSMPNLSHNMLTTPKLEKAMFNRIFAIS